MYSLRLFFFIRTTLFTTMFTAIIVVCSLKSRCIPSFVFVVPIYIPSVVYGLRLFIVVVQELHFLSNCLHVCMIRVRVCYHFIKSTPAGF